MTVGPLTASHKLVELFYILTVIAIDIASCVKEVDGASADRLACGRLINLTMFQVCGMSTLLQ